MTAVLDRPRLTVPVSGRDHILGSATATRMLLEYGDYECPFCAAAHPVVKQLLRTVGDEVTFAFRHFPLTQIHPQAELAAEAAEAAGSQGSFWEMHDVLFENQPRLADADLRRYADRVGLDVERFDADMARHAYAGGPCTGAARPKRRGVMGRVHATSGDVDRCDLCQLRS